MRATRLPLHVRALLAAALCAVVAASPAAGQTAGGFTPTVGQPGKDVVWVPTSPRLVEAMLNLAGVTAKDFVVDLGSGDGRNIIAAAKRGARGLGVEYNPDMVELSRRLAAEAGVADRATFVRGDMYEADISQATVLALFLLPENMLRLRPKFLALAPGTRIVANTFGIESWNPDETIQLDEEESSWRTALLWIVPAQVGGTWRLGGDEVSLVQDYQRVSGTTVREGRTVTVQSGRLRGAEIEFRVEGVLYRGRVTGDTMRGTALVGGQEQAWSATRVARP